VGYSSWFRQHGEKHRKIMEKLTHMSNEEVIAYFRFENMVIHEPDFCPLYKENRKCHEIDLLNCYLCACPNFRFDDSGFREIKEKTLYSYCSINSEDGSVSESKEALHQNCSACTVPHHEAYIRKHFKREWFTIMKRAPSRS